MKHGRMLLHQAFQRGLPRAVVLVLDRGAIGRLWRLSTDGLHACSRVGDLGQFQAAHRVAVAHATTCGDLLPGD